MLGAYRSPGHLGHLGHGPWVDEHASAPAIEYQFHTCNADQTRSRILWLWVRHADLRPSPNFAMWCKACNDASVHLCIPSRTRPQPPSHHLPTHHHGTTRPPPGLHHGTMTTNRCHRSYSNHRSDTHPDPSTLCHSPIRPDEKAEPPLARLDVRLGKQDPLAKLINRMTRGRFTASQEDAGLCAMLPTLRSERSRSQMDKFEVKVSTREKTAFLYDQRTLMTDDL